MKFEAVTIKDIAKALGIFTSTVSPALPERYEISPHTKQLAIESTEKLYYRPNPMALAMEIGKAATELLLQLIESKRAVTQFENRVLTPELIMRKFTKILDENK